MDDIEQRENLQLTKEMLSEENFYELFMNFHTYEQAQFYVTLNAEERQQVRDVLTPDEMCLIFELVENDEDNMQELLLEIDRPYATSMLMAMSRDNVVDILKKVSPDVVRSYLRHFPSDVTDDILSLFQYEDETAGSLMTTEYVTVSATQSAHEALESFKQQASSAEMINYAYVVDVNHQLLGIVSLRDVLTADENTFIPDIMIDRIVSVQVDDDQETVTKMIRDYDLVAVPVVSADDELLGIVTIDDIVDIMDEGAVSDYSGLAGVDVEDVESNVLSSALSRVPWLIVLMLIAIFTSAFIGNFNQLLSQHAVLYTFITLITGTAGNAGTQALAVTIRKLAVQNKISVMKFIVDELCIGIILGVLTGAIVMVTIVILQHDLSVGFVLGLSMLVAIVMATLVGNVIPIIIVKCGVDPTVASGPFINTLCDLTSVVIYVMIANLFLQYII